MQSSDKIDPGPLVFKFQVVPMCTESISTIPEFFHFIFYFYFQIVHIQVVNVQYHRRNVRGALEILSPREARRPIKFSLNKKTASELLLDNIPLIYHTYRFREINTNPTIEFSSYYAETVLLIKLFRHEPLLFVTRKKQHISSLRYKVFSM